MCFFAGDTTLFCTNKNLSAVHEYKEKVQTVDLYCKANRIKIENSQAANFGRKKIAKYLSEENEKRRNLQVISNIWA